MRDDPEPEQEAPPTLGGVPEAVAALGRSTDALTIAVKGSQQRNRQFHMTMAGIAAVLIALLVIGLVLVGKSKAVSQANGRTNDRILSCTSPTGACYLRGQRQTGNAVNQILGVVAREITAALVCQRREPDASYNRFLLCIAARTRKPPQPDPSPSPTTVGFP